MSAQPVTPFCVLCGVRCVDPDCFRLVDCKEMQDFARARCTPTAFHYAALLAHPATDRRAVCTPCLSWKRRAFKGQTLRIARPGKTFTPLDSVVMFALAPGQAPEPDRRSMERLVSAAADPDNGYAWSIPDAARLLLASAVDDSPDNVATTVVKGWWRANERTSFFRHPATARAVRHTCVLRDPAELERGRRWRK